MRAFASASALLLAAAGVPGRLGHPGLRVPASHVHAPRRACAPLCTAEAPAEPSETGVEFPAPLSVAQRLKRASTFWARAIPVISSYLRTYTQLNVRERLLGECLSDEECEVVWQEEHERGASVLARAIDDLKGFYVKTGQIIATREDLFPRAYTEKLRGLTDFLDPMPTSLVKAVIVQELLPPGIAFTDVFAEFDERPLGAASVAQVHRAVLTPAYGGKEVAVKVQRPAIESKLMGDVGALKALAASVRPLEAIPVDYYVVFSELESQASREYFIRYDSAIPDAASPHRSSATSSTSRSKPNRCVAYAPRSPPTSTAHRATRRSWCRDRSMGSFVSACS